MITKYEWTLKQVDIAIKECPPDNRQYIDAFLAEVEKAGQSLTRTQFFELYKAGEPPDDVEYDYFQYSVLGDHWKLIADFTEAWDMPPAEPLPRITTIARLGSMDLPADFCTLGGTPEWIENRLPPICPECDVDMALLLQLKSLPYSITENMEALRSFTFGDAGNFYVFQCIGCGTHQTTWDCH